MSPIFAISLSRSRLEIAFRTRAILRSRTPDSHYVVYGANSIELNGKASNDTVNLYYQASGRPTQFC